MASGKAKEPAKKEWIELYRQNMELQRKIEILEAERDSYKNFCERLVGTMMTVVTDYNDSFPKKNRDAAFMKEQAQERMRKMRIKDLSVSIYDTLWNPIREELGFDKEDESFGEITVKRLFEKVPFILECKWLGVGKAIKICKLLKKEGLSPNPWEKELLSKGYNCD